MKKTLVLLLAVALIVGCGTLYPIFASNDLLGDEPKGETTLGVEESDTLSEIQTETPSKESSPLNMGPTTKKLAKSTGTATVQNVGSDTEWFHAIKLGGAIKLTADLSLVQLSGEADQYGHAHLKVDTEIDLNGHSITITGGKFNYIDQNTTITIINTSTSIGKITTSAAIGLFYASSSTSSLIIGTDGQYNDSILLENTSTENNSYIICGGGSVTLNSGTLKTNSGTPIESNSLYLNDGVLIGNNPYTVSNITIKNGYYLASSNDNSIFTVTEIGNNTALVNGAAYDNFASALAAASDGDTVQLLAEVSPINDETNISKNIILDLNGKKLNLSDAKTAVTSSKLIISGEVTITDTNQSKTGSIFTPEVTDCKGIYVTGTLNLVAGRIETNKVSNTTAYGNMPNYNYNHALLSIATSGKANVTSGTISCTSSNSSQGCLIRIQYGGTLDMSGGKVNYEDSNDMFSFYVIFNLGRLNLSGSTEITGKRSNDQLSLIYNGDENLFPQRAETHISGGTYTHSAPTGWALIKNDSGQYLNISGGSFTSKNGGSSDSGQVISSFGDIDIVGGNFLCEGNNALSINSGKSVIGGKGLTITSNAYAAIDTKITDASKGSITISEGTYTGNNNGIYNTGTIDKIDSATIVGNNYNGISNDSSSAIINGVSNCTITGNNNGIYNTGAIDKIDGATIVGNNYNGIYNAGSLSLITSSNCTGPLTGMDNNGSKPLKITGSTFKQEGAYIDDDIWKGYGFSNYDGDVKMADTHIITSTTGKSALFSGGAAKTDLTSCRLTAQNGYGIGIYGNATVTTHEACEFVTKDLSKNNSIIAYTDVSTISPVQLPTGYTYSDQVKRYDDTGLEYWWIGKSAKVSFDPNNGEKVTGPISYVVGDTIDIPDTDPRRPGKIFAGWKLKNKTISSDFELTESDLNSDGTVLLTAQYFNYPPIDPGQPDNPDNPDDPDKPDNPDQPDDPDDPDKPDNPDQPDDPDKPDNPDKSSGSTETPQTWDSSILILYVLLGTTSTLLLCCLIRLRRYKA